MNTKKVNKGFRRGGRKKLFDENDLALAKNVNPYTFAEYLSGSGWIQYHTKRRDIRVYQTVNAEGKAFQVNIPMDKDLLDYAYALGQAVKTAAMAENKTAGQLVQDLL